MLPASNDIVATAASAGDFQTLSRALQAAELVSTLKGKGPFTVFAPTDEAFAKLPAGDLERLLMPANKNRLQNILTSHVVAGNWMANDVGKMTLADTVGGAPLNIRKVNGQLMLNEARVVKSDIVFSNGVIHGIDRVFLP